MKFKKAVSAIAALAICSVLMPVSDMPVINGTAIVAQAEETEVTTVTKGTCGENVTWEYADGVLTISGEGPMFSYGDPPNEAPYYHLRNEIETAIIEDGVTTVGNGAFFRYSNLKNVTIPVGVTSIGSYAFFGTGITSIVIPEGVTSIGNEAFKSCSKLESISLPSTLTSLGTYQFQGCYALTKVVIPDGCNVLTENSSFPGNITVSYTGKCGENATWELNSDGVLTISGTGATYDYENRYMSENVPPWFKNVYNSDTESYTFTTSKFPITSIVVEEGITSLGKCVFSACDEVTTVSLPSTLTSIGNGAFLWDSSLTSIVIPEGVVSIGNDAFTGCAKITEVILPETLNSIGLYAFTSCTALKEVIIPSGMANVKDNRFSDNTLLIYQKAWQFKEINMNQWQNGKLYFDYANDVDGTSGKTDGVIFSNFVYDTTGNDTILSGESTINFNIIVLEDVENTHFTRVYIKAPTAAEASEINLASGAFDPEAEIDEAEFIEIGDSEFDVE